MAQQATSSWEPYEDPPQDRRLTFSSANRGSESANRHFARQIPPSPRNRAGSRRRTGTRASGSYEEAKYGEDEGGEEDEESDDNQQLFVLHWRTQHPIGEFPHRMTSAERNASSEDRYTAKELGLEMPRPTVLIPEDVRGTREEFEQMFWFKGTRQDNVNYLTRAIFEARLLARERLRPYARSQRSDAYAESGNATAHFLATRMQGPRPDVSEDSESDSLSDRSESDTEEG